jgi:hypothetical protein
MNTAVRCGAVVLLVLSAACGDAGPTSPTGPSLSQALPSPTPAPSTNFPPVSGPSRAFIFDHDLSYPVSGYTKQSRFVLYDNGAFVLQYLGGLGGEYRGAYAETNGVITFRWEGWSVAGPWGATGTLKGDLLTVQYNLIMQLTDFEDAVYALRP